MMVAARRAERLTRCSVDRSPVTSGSGGLDCTRKLTIPLPSPAPTRLSRAGAILIPDTGFWYSG